MTSRPSPPVTASPPTTSPHTPATGGAISRAITKTSAGLHREGFLLRPIKRSSTELLYGIVREEKDESAARLDHDFEATVSWSTEPDPSLVTGDHPVARRVAEAYQELRGKVVADDWSGVITAYLESHDAARVRGDGRVYWIPPQRVAEVRQFGAFLAEVGIDLVLCEIEAESRTVVEAVAAESLDEQLAHLEAEVAAFDGTQKPSTYTRRLEDYQRLRQRAYLYRDALGLGVEKAEQVLSDLEQKVQAMLDIRRQTVVHRDGTIDRAHDGTDAPRTETTDSATPVASLRFAGSTFTAAESDDPAVLVFVADDNYARSSVQALESMGLAGKWQQAGACQVAIQNSGPPGAAVSIRLRLPAGQDLSASTKSLANLGIELVA